MSGTPVVSCYRAFYAVDLRWWIVVFTLTLEDRVLFESVISVRHTGREGNRAWYHACVTSVIPAEIPSHTTLGGGGGFGVHDVQTNGALKLRSTTILVLLIGKQRIITGKPCYGRGYP